MEDFNTLFCNKRQLSLVDWNFPQAKRTRVPTTVQMKRWKTVPVHYVGCSLSSGEELIDSCKYPSFESPLAAEEEFMKTFKLPLLEHQLTGLRWMSSAESLSAGNGGIVADEPGLGKTLMVCALMAHSIFQGPSKPQLIVCPKSVVTHWMNEAKKANIINISVLKHKDKSVLASTPAKDLENKIFVTTFECLTQKDKQSSPTGTSNGKKPGGARDPLTLIEWERIIIDEAHNVKNPKCLAFTALQQLRSRTKWCITGTPVMNHVNDVATLSCIATPNQKFNYMDEDRERGWKRKHLLRRLKSEVNLILHTTVLEEWVNLLPSEVGGYNSLEQEAVTRYFSKRTFGCKDDNDTNLLPVLGKLRRYCDHPVLAWNKTEELPKDLTHSAKTMKLIEIMRSYPPDTKFVVFSQWTKMLDVCDRLITESGAGKCIKFDGRIHDVASREKSIQDFTEKDYNVMLTSLKAGGVGINLTAANIVISFDP